jgi:long-subunit fatty acid transport protein
MKLCRRVFLGGVAWIMLLWLPPLRSATAGGLLLPGAGAVSTSRAGAAVASADDGEALVLNPAGLAKSEGTTITLSAAMIQYAMQFQRRGTYDAVPGETYPYAGQPFNLVKNDASAPLGFGSIQPVPVFAVISDLGGRIPGLHVAIGLYAPNAYPFRDLCVDQGGSCQKYELNVTPANAPPPSTRYDVMKQDAAVLLPSLAIAYRVMPQLDVGLRLSAGYANLKSTTALWGTATPNYEEDIKKDGVLAADATDSFVPGFGIGLTYRPTVNLEFAANYSSELDVHAKGTATSQLGPSAGIPGTPTTIGARADDSAQCAPGGTDMALKACVDLAVPRNLQLAGRYKFLDAAGKLKGDIELDLDWENWGKSCSDDDFNNGQCVSPGDYRVVVDAQLVIAGAPTGVNLKNATIKHGFQNTYGVRVGGSYHIDVGALRDDGNHDQVILRGGLGYDTAAARTGWLRVDLDGAARTTLAVGAGYRTRRFEVSVGGGAILEGSPSNPNVGGGATPCNPTGTNPSCGASERQGPDPVNPILDPQHQAENPVNQGDYKSHYLLFMLGASTWF